MSSAAPHRRHPVTTIAPTSGTLDVPGARLHYTSYGRGPLLLTIPGGPADGGMFAPLAPLLAADRTVVTFDPRGLSASTVVDATAEITVAIQADDARRLVGVLGDGRADVLASSGGALTALELVARHPGAVGTLVAHEPPLTYLLPDAADDPQDAVIMDIYRREGAGPAMMAFLDHIGVFGDGPLPPAEAMAPMVPNFDVFFGRMWASLGRSGRTSTRCAAAAPGSSSRPATPRAGSSPSGPPRRSRRCWAGRRSRCRATTAGSPVSRRPSRRRCGRSWGTSFPAVATG